MSSPEAEHCVFCFILWYGWFVCVLFDCGFCLVLWGFLLGFGFCLVFLCVVFFVLFLIKNLINKIVLCISEVYTKVRSIPWKLLLHKCIVINSDWINH